MAFARKRQALDKGDSNGGVMSPLWNALVFSKVKAKLGGRVRLLTTGASPISPDVMAFLRVCFPGALVLEGYGPLLSSMCGSLHLLFAHLRHACTAASRLSCSFGAASSTYLRSVPFSMFVHTA
jgi:hypothetical protein